MLRESMREAYGETLVELGKTNPDVVVLDADVSSSTRTALFGAAFPERFFNVGIAEGNMMAIAAGLAACGKVPFVNTFAVFATMRAGDPLRSLVAYPGLNVKIVGAYGGVSDSYDGASHQSVEDIAVVRSIPHMTVVVAADAVEARLATLAAATSKGPVYLRMSRADVPVIFDASSPFVLGRANTLRSGGDLTIMATGCTVHMALEAVQELSGLGLHARLLEVHTIKPIDEEALLAAARETGAVLTVEEHSVYGGLGSAVAEVICQKCPVPMRILGFPDRFGESGGYDEVLARMGLTTQQIVQAAQALIQGKRS